MVFYRQQDNIHTELPDICKQLRENIREEFHELEWQDSALKDRKRYRKDIKKQLLLLVTA